jgi:hypothetical protein
MTLPAKVINGKIVFNPITLAQFVAKNEGKTFDLVEREQKITGRQRRALELWFRLLADTLNEAGYSVQTILKAKKEIDWTHDNVKELLWKSTQRALFNKPSTKQLKKTEEIDLIYNHLVRHLGEKFGIEVPPWPHFETGQDYIEATSTLSTEG